LDAEKLRAQHPDIEVEASVLYVQQERIYTSAGSAAGIDLLLHIVRQDFGAAAANSVARRLVTPPHRSAGQAQFIERPVTADRNNRIARLLDAVRKDLDAHRTVVRMAQAAAMSPRTFLRRFTESTGQSPGHWLIAERIAEAQRLLESSDLPIERIAALAGFGSVQALRHHFQCQLALSPTEYRSTFTLEP